ncbi:MAG: DMT family transporter [Clostridia bacterium]|nr:DMT family transporter [Clostridia bacterium]
MAKTFNFKKILGPVILAVGALIWGISFVAQSEGGAVGSYTFQGTRNTLAFLTVGLVTLIRDLAQRKKKPRARYGSGKAFFSAHKTALLAGLLCGIAYTIAATVQQLGIDIMGTDVSAGRAGFLTALYIVLVPVLGIFLKKKITLKAWCSVAVAVVGLYLISVKPGTGFKISFADVLLIICALFFAIQILLIDSFSQKVDGLHLSCMEFFFASVVTVLMMFAFENPDIEVIKANWLMIAYSGVLSGGVAYTFQILGQQMTPPVLASLIMSLESVFSALSDWLIRGNTLNARELSGCVIMFAAITIAQLPEFKRKKQQNAA